MPVSRYLGIPYWKPYTALSANNNHVSTSKHYKLFPKQKLIQKFFSHVHDIPVLSLSLTTVHSSETDKKSLFSTELRQPKTETLE